MKTTEEKLAAFGVQRSPERELAVSVTSLWFAIFVLFAGLALNYFTDTVHGYRIERLIQSDSAIIELLHLNGELHDSIIRGFQQYRIDVGWPFPLERRP